MRAKKLYDWFLHVRSVWGECTHVFHMHCLLKWIGTVASKQQCPMDRRAWGTFCLKFLSNARLLSYSVLFFLVTVTAERKVASWRVWKALTVELRNIWYPWLTECSTVSILLSVFLIGSFFLSQFGERLCMSFFLPPAKVGTILICPFYRNN